MPTSARAFVPGHVTGFFGAHPHDDPSRAGSRGAGVALSDGVTVLVEPRDGASPVTPPGGDAGADDDAAGDGHPLQLDGEVVQVEAVDRVLDALDVSARVVAESELPIGSGFGVSGALALGTALAAAEAFDLARSENELVEAAHVAEVRAGSGLGDVVAQARGGVPVRLSPGAPGHGAMDGIPAPDRRIEYVTFGELSTADVLAGDTEALTAAGDRALEDLRAAPTLETFLATSRRFAREAELLTVPVREAIEAVEADGGEAAMAMLGETVFALGPGLSDAGYDPQTCEIHLAGGHLL